jgi:hypothetical protein
MPRSGMPSERSTPMITISPNPAAPFQVSASPQTPPASSDGIDLRPGSAYEAITRQMVESLTDDMKEIKTRLNNLFYMVIGAILIDILSRWIGA